MGEVPIKYVFHGDREAGKGYMRRGAVLMDMLEHAMSYQGLQQGVMRRRPIRGVLIECDHRFGLRTVTITVDPQTPEEIVVVEERELHGVVVAVSCSSGLFLHHGRWKNKKPFSEGRHQYAHYAPIPDGWSFNGGQWYYHMVSWAGLRDTPRRATLPRKISDTYYDLWIRTTGQGYNRADARYARNAPVVMPGFTGEDIVLSHNIMYAADDERLQFYADCLRLSEVTAQQWDDDGRQNPTTKWIYANRGFGFSGYVLGKAPLFDVVPMPERNGVRRFVTLPLSHGIQPAPAIFCHVSMRGQDDVRRFAFTNEMVGEVFPAEFDWTNRSDRCVFQAQAYMDDVGAVHVCFALTCREKNGTDEYANLDAVTARWSTCMVYVTLPSLTQAMTAEGERAYLQDNMTVRVLPWGDFLPLLDMLHTKIFDLPGGRGSKEGVNSILTVYDFYNHEGDYWYNVRSKTKPQYVIDGVVYHEGNTPYNIANCHLQFERSMEIALPGIWVARQEALYVLAYALGYDMPADSVVFHGGQAAQWYSWTRMWGGLSITPDALSPVEMTWPAEIETDGVKPEVTWAGNGLYCCVCYDTCNRMVSAVYIGTPFGTAEQAAWWRKVPLVRDEWAEREGNGILLIRPALATLARVVLLAVVRDGAACRAAYCDGHPDTALLEFCGAVPLGREDEEGMSLDICDFGADGYAEILRAYPSPPRASGGWGYSNAYRYHDARNPDGWTGYDEFVDTWYPAP